MGGRSIGMFRRPEGRRNLILPHVVEGAASLSQVEAGGEGAANVVLCGAHRFFHRKIHQYGRGETAYLYRMFADNQ